MGWLAAVGKALGAGAKAAGRGMYKDTVGQFIDPFHPRRTSQNFTGMSRAFDPNTGTVGEPSLKETAMGTEDQMLPPPSLLREGEQPGEPLGGAGMRRRRPMMPTDWMFWR
jgi:hypothetical protein